MNLYVSIATRAATLRTETARWQKPTFLAGKDGWIPIKLALPAQRGQESACLNGRTSRGSIDEFKSTVGGGVRAAGLDRRAVFSLGRGEQFERRLDAASTQGVLLERLPV